MDCGTGFVNIDGVCYKRCSKAGQSGQCAEGQRCEKPLYICAPPRPLKWEGQMTPA
jgi:hypothetical protein